MEVYLQEITTQKDMEAVSGMAREIWQEHYAGVISQAQIEYMLEKFQSAPAIGEALKDGYRYYFICGPEGPAGYTAVRTETAKKSLFLSKLYLQKNSRGKGYAYRAVNLLAQQAKAQGLLRIYLTVNKENSSVARYRRMGFAVAGPVQADIGGGFIMDDYLMELIL